MATTLSFDVDVKVVLAIVGAAASLWLFLRRWREESHKTRLVELQKKALDQLFRFRTTLIACLDRLEDAPDVVDDETANAFYSTVRSVRRDVKHTINEFLLFSTREEFEGLHTLYREADRQFHVFAEQLAKRHVDYSAANSFKRAIYQILEDIEVRILQAQQLDGRERSPEINAVRVRYGQLRSDIDALISSASGFTPVQPKSPDTSAVPTTQSMDAPGDEGQQR